MGEDCGTDYLALIIFGGRDYLALTIFGDDNKEGENFVACCWLLLCYFTYYTLTAEGHWGP